jgi:Fe-Mn family superoxide dismutase
MKRYEPEQFPRLKGLSGISDGLLQDHLKLYEGYLKNTNELTNLDYRTCEARLIK